MRFVQTRHPLLHWDRFSLRFDLDAVQFVIDQQLQARSTAIRDLHVAGDEGGVQLRARISLKGLPTSLSARLEDLRLYRRFFGCHVASLRGPLGLPLPLALLERILDAVDTDRIGFDADDGILTIDLRDSLPPGLDLRVSDVRCVARVLIVTVANGAWTPTSSDLLLPPEGEGADEGM